MGALRMPSTNANTAVASLAQQYWEERLHADPVEATFLGDRRFDDRMPDLGPEAHRRETARLEALSTRVRALPTDGLSDADQVTLAALTGEIESDLAQRACRLSEWTVDPRDGPQVLFLNLAHLQTVTTPAQGSALLARWRLIAPDLDQRIANLRHGISAGKVATRGSVERVLRQLDELLAQPVGQWVLLSPGSGELPAWPEPDREPFRTTLRQIVEGQIRPAFQRYRDVLHTQVLPRARGDESVGLSHIPDGAACYQRLIKVQTSLTLAPDAIHAQGLSDVAHIRDEISALGSKVFGTNDFGEIVKRLRGDRGLFFHTRDQVEAKAAEALRRADAAMPRWFGRLPKTPCVVKRIEAYEEKDSTIAYYRQPAVDASRPGTYYINTYQPETRPTYEAEALAFHESIPGHHTQIAIAQELPGVPEFRRHLGVTAFVEGWALYTERLADEMGLYSGDLDRMGMLSFDAWRASRLVVDTGLHVKGWSRQQAIQFMRDNTALADNNIENEVDRYIGWPAQALAYKTGQREIFKLRHETEARLGARFDIRRFHDAVLENGAVSLAVLRQYLERTLQ